MPISVEPPELVRTKSDHNTPDGVLKVIRRVGAIGLDPCSNPWSRVRARVELSAHRGEDGLSAPWSEILRPGELGFDNPPYTVGQIPIWIEKTIEEAERGAQSIVLVPADPSTKAFQRAWRACDALCLWDRRIQFRGAARNGNMWPSVFWYWGPNPWRFAHYFARHGIVQVQR